MKAPSPPPKFKTTTRNAKKRETGIWSPCPPRCGGNVRGDSRREVDRVGVTERKEGEQMTLTGGQKKGRSLGTGKNDAIVKNLEMQLSNMNRHSWVSAVYCKTNKETRIRNGDLFPHIRTEKLNSPAQRRTRQEKGATGGVKGGEG